MLLLRFLSFIRRKFFAEKPCGFTKKQYLCKPIIIRRTLNGLYFCVLIAFLIGLGERLVNHRTSKSVPVKAPVRKNSSNKQEVLTHNEEWTL